MRIWSLHPQYLDRQGLLACWRETLLAQAVLAGRTRGYRNHPQLDRFRAQGSPPSAVAGYLHHIADEADRRGYRFNRDRIDLPFAPLSCIPVTGGQLEFEWAHLKAKLIHRSPERLECWAVVRQPFPHPSFQVVEGPVEPWERTMTA